MTKRIQRKIQIENLMFAHIPGSMRVLITMNHTSTKLHHQKTKDVQISLLINYIINCRCVCDLVSGMCSMHQLWGGESLPTWIPNSNSSYSSPRIWVINSHYLSLTKSYACQWQETISYTDYSRTYMNTTYNEQRTDKRYTNSSAYGTFSFVTCDTRDIVLP